MRIDQFFSVLIISIDGYIFFICKWVFLCMFQSNISLILHAVGEYELSLRFLEKALALNIQFYGPKSLKVAVSYHLVARTQSCMGDFRSALNNEKETYAIYKQQVCELFQRVYYYLGYSPFYCIYTGALMCSYFHICYYFYACLFLLS